MTPTHADTPPSFEARPTGLPIALVGCDFRIAPSTYRAALVLDAEERQVLHEKLQSAAEAPGLAILDTCNRTEWIVEAPDPEWAVDLLRAWMLRRWRERLGEGTLPSPYAHVGVDAVRHFLRVAVGLESLVPGEREIAGQCHRALVEARSGRRASPLINELGNAAGRTVRRVERLCTFRDATRGVPRLAADLALQGAAGTGREPRIGVAGMGLIGRKVVALLEERLAQRVLAFNRTIPDTRRERWQPLVELRPWLAELDALVVATSASEPVLDLAAVTAAPRRSPLLVIDLGIPPQVVAAPEADATSRLVALDDLVSADVGRVDPKAQTVAHETVEAGVQDFARAVQVRASARLLEAVHRSRRRLQGERLPALLDEHLGDLPPATRRRLETALRALMRHQHRDLLEALEDLAALDAPERGE